MRLLLFMVPIFLLISCNKNFKEKIGLVTIGPNEYEVTRMKELEVPPHYELLTPTTKN